MGGTGTLIPGQHQQFGVDDQQFGSSFFEGSARLDPGTNHVEPVDGNGFDTLLAVGHKGEGPERMAVSIGTVTGRLSAAAMSKSERTRKGIVGDLEAGHQEARAAAKAGGLGTARRRSAWVHLIVIIQSDTNKKQGLRQMFLTEIVSASVSRLLPDLADISLRGKFAVQELV